MALFFNILLFQLLAAGHAAPVATAATGKVTIRFINQVKGSPLVLNEVPYTNPSGETYRVKKCRYYISNVALEKNGAWKREKDSYHLIDQSDSNSLSFSFSLPAGNYTSIRFLLGVDSLKNVSGAQTGALDPLHDMFWTWNTGYVMAKLEAVSPQSKLARQKVEYHIGGFKGDNNVLKEVSFSFAGINGLGIKNGMTSEIMIAADIDQWWGPEKLSIADTPACNTPGKLAKKIAGNYVNMFSILQTTHY